MAKPTIFTISAVWDEAASVWSGHCDEIPAGADAATLDELLTKISAMAIDVLADIHPSVDPSDAFLTDHSAARSRGDGRLSGTTIRQAIARSVVASGMHAGTERQGQP